MCLGIATTTVLTIPLGAGTMTANKPGNRKISSFAEHRLERVLVDVLFQD